MTVILFFSGIIDLAVGAGVIAAIAYWQSKNAVGLAETEKKEMDTIQSSLDSLKS